MRRNLPAFANETEEANWWYENREKHAEEFAEAARQGLVRRGGIVRRMAEAEAARNLTLSQGDAMKAVLLAQEKGVEVQTYLTELIHKTLVQELENAAGQS